jgi:hypothetical protein
LGNRIAALLLAMILLEGGLWTVVVRMSRDKWKSPHMFWTLDARIEITNKELDTDDMANKRRLDDTKTIYA